MTDRLFVLDTVQQKTTAMASSATGGDMGEQTDLVIGRPQVEHEDMMDILQQSYQIIPHEITELKSYTDRNFLIQAKVTNQSSMQGTERCFVLKITGCDGDITEAQERHKVYHALAKYLHEAGFVCPVPQMSATNSNLLNVLHVKTSSGKKLPCVVQLLSYIPGQVMYDMAVDAPKLYLVGQFIAELRQTTKTFIHPLLSETTDDLWAMENIPDLRSFLSDLEDDSNCPLVMSVIEKYERDVVGNLDKLEKGVIHGDIHDENLIWLQHSGDSMFSQMTRTSPTITSPIQTSPGNHSISKHDSLPDAKKSFGLIDFGDIGYSCLVFDLVIALTYFMSENTDMDFKEVGGHILAGYLSVCPLDPIERDVLYISICARYCQELVLGEHEFRNQPDNVYVKSMSGHAWPQLRQLCSMSKQHLYEIWENVIKEYKSHIKAR